MKSAMAVNVFSSLLFLSHFAGKLTGTTVEDQRQRFIGKLRGRSRNGIGFVALHLPCTKLPIIRSVPGGQVLHTRFLPGVDGFSKSHPGTGTAAGSGAALTGIVFHRFRRGQRNAEADGPEPHPGTKLRCDQEIAAAQRTQSRGHGCVFEIDEKTGECLSAESVRVL